jgi:hypothetical protein
MLRHITATQAQTYLSVFRGIENLWLHVKHSHDTPPPLALEVPSLKHLYSSLQDLYRFIQFSSLSHPIFINITHLELFRNLGLHGLTIEWTELTALPCLTHLAFNGEDMIPICVGVLAALESLRALIILQIPPVDMPSEYEVLATDPRFVMTPVRDYLDDWQEGVLTGRDYWVRADEFIAKKRSGEIDSESLPLNIPDTEQRIPQDTNFSSRKNECKNSFHSLKVLFRFPASYSGYPVCVHIFHNNNIICICPPMYQI